MLNQLESQLCIIMKAMFKNMTCNYVIWEVQNIEILNKAIPNYNSFYQYKYIWGWESEKEWERKSWNTNFPSKYVKVDFMHVRAFIFQWCMVNQNIKGKIVARESNMGV